MAVKAVISSVPGGPGWNDGGEAGGAAVGAGAVRDGAVGGAPPHAAGKKHATTISARILVVIPRNAGTAREKVNV